MLKTLGLIFIGFALSWISMMIAIENYIYRSESDKRLIDELMTENKKYKDAMDRYQARFDSD